MKFELHNLFHGVREPKGMGLNNKILLDSLLNFWKSEEIF